LGAVSPGAAVAELLAQREDDRGDCGRVAAGRGNAATSSTKNRVQHAQVIGAGATGETLAALLRPATPGQHPKPLL
jgi:hypothetical protein